MVFICNKNCNLQQQCSFCFFFFSDNVDRTQVPRIPWRDLGAVHHGKAARDLARHFIQRWNFTKVSNKIAIFNVCYCSYNQTLQNIQSLPFFLYLSFKIFKNKYKDDFYPYLLPKSNCTADNLPFTIPGATKASVQVHVFMLFTFLFFVSTHLISFLFCCHLFIYIFFSPRFFVLWIAGLLAHVNILSSTPIYMLSRTASITFIQR